MKTKVKNITVETWLPIFPGFYNTYFEYSNENRDIESFNEDHNTNLEYNDFEWNYVDYHYRVGKEVTEIISKYINKILKCKIKFQEISSPREYNFRNDSINIKVKLNLDELKEKILQDESYFAQWIKSEYTSRNGFISHYSNEYEVWLNEYLNEDSSELSHCVGACLNFLVSDLITSEGLYHECEEIGYISYEPIVEKLLEHGANSVENIHNGISDNIYNFEHVDKIYILSSFVGENLTPTQLDKVNNILSQLEEIKGV